MDFTEDGRIVLIRLDMGEKIVSTLLGFLEDRAITSGHISGIGAVSEVNIARYLLGEKRFESLNLAGEFEVTSLTGLISKVDGKPHVHIHIVLGDSEFRALTGHLNEGVVGPTLELVIHKADISITRKEDSEVGLSLLDFGK